MKKQILILLAVVFLSQTICAQKYFKPVVGGLETVKDGKDYYLVTLEGKTSKEIYDALMVMVKETFKGSEDDILEIKEGSFIKAKGVSKDIICGTFDVISEIEFRIKDGRYIFKIPKFNMISYQGDQATEIIFQKGNTFSSHLYKGKVFLFNKKGKMRIKKQCRKDIIAVLDAMGKIFDISNEVDKYLEKKKEEESGW